MHNPSGSLKRKTIRNKEKFDPVHCENGVTTFIFRLPLLAA